MATVRVWVGCQAHYTDGHLIGDWVPATEAPEWVCPRRAPSYAPCEETWIFDHEIPGVKGEMSPDTAARWGTVFEELDDNQVEAFGAFLSHVGEDAPSDDLVRRFQEAYRGEWDSERDYAMQEFEELYGSIVDEDMSESLYSPYKVKRIPEIFMHHFDWDSWTDAVFRHGDHTRVGRHVFRDED